jgi:hypothetical protein
MYQKPLGNVLKRKREAPGQKQPGAHFCGKTRRDILLPYQTLKESFGVLWQSTAQISNIERTREEVGILSSSADYDVL